MIHIENDTETIEMQQNDWQNPESETTTSMEDNEERTFYGDLYENNTVIYASADEIDSKEDKDDDEKEEEKSGDWGHVDPAESDSPFPNPNAPTAPGSAV